MHLKASNVAQVKNPFASAEDTASVPRLGRSPDKEMATRCSILAWEIHGQRSLTAATHVVTKESDTT